MWDQFRAAMRLQAAFTVAAVLVAGWLAGVHGAVSAGLGGLIGIAGGLAFVLIASKSKAKNKETSAGDVLGIALKAEGAKLVLMIVLVVVVLKSYRQGVALIVIGAFVVSALIFSIGAFAGRTDPQQKV